MSAIKRSVMTLYSDSDDVYSHRVRIVLAEKGVSVNILTIDPDELPEDLTSLNPYGSLPTLVDRTLVLYETSVITEYLDERFPHPPLLPVYPIARAKSRLMIYRICRDWYTLMEQIKPGGNDKASIQARKDLANSLLSLAPVFGQYDYFLSDEFSLVDCVLAPLLWRLPLLGVELPAKAKVILTYCDRLFARDTFQASLSENEREMREGI